MSRIMVQGLQQASIWYIYNEREDISLDPDYQRQGDIWPVEKRQLLIDSLLNGFDIPKIYFHELSPPLEMEGRRYRYAIIDGKQRLTSIWGFIDGKFPLGDDIVFLDDPAVELKGLTYKELGERYPRIKNKFDATSLPIFSVRTDEIEMIEDMFTRLNEGEPLNAAEKRQAFGGPLTPAIKQLSSHKFFSQKIPFGNKRYRHYDVIAKFLYLLYREALTDTKKAYLDDFARSFKKNPNPQNALEAVNGLVAQSTVILDQMAATFVETDKLLRNVGSVIVYFWLFHRGHLGGWANILARKPFADFEDFRTENRARAEADITTAVWDLLEYDRLAQSPNDGAALAFRYRTLVSALREKFGLDIPEDELKEPA